MPGPSSPNRKEAKQLSIVLGMLLFFLSYFFKLLFFLSKFINMLPR